MHTLFPSPKTEEGIKGGVVLLRLAPPAGTAIAAAPPLRLEACYQDRWVWSVWNEGCLGLGLCVGASLARRDPTKRGPATGARYQASWEWNDLGSVWTRRAMCCMEAGKPGSCGRESATRTGRAAGAVAREIVLCRLRCIRRMSAGAAYAPGCAVRR